MLIIMFLFVKFFFFQGCCNFRRGIVKFFIFRNFWFRTDCRVCLNKESAEELARMRFSKKKIIIIKSICSCLYYSFKKGNSSIAKYSFLSVFFGLCRIVGSIQDVNLQNNLSDCYSLKKNVKIEKKISPLSELLSAISVTLPLPTRS